MHFHGVPSEASMQYGRNSTTAKSDRMLPITIRKSQYTSWRPIDQVDFCPEICLYRYSIPLNLSAESRKQVVPVSRKTITEWIKSWEVFRPIAAAVGLIVISRGIDVVVLHLCSGRISAMPVVRNRI